MTSIIKDMSKARQLIYCAKSILEEVQTDISIAFEDEESEEYMEVLLQGGEDMSDDIEDILLALSDIEDDLIPYTYKDDT